MATCLRGVTQCALVAALGSAAGTGQHFRCHHVVYSDQQHSPGLIGERGDESGKARFPGIGCFLMALWYSTSIVLGDDGHVLILNAATEPVKNGQLEVCGQKFMFGELAQGNSKAIQYKVRSDSQYKLEVEFYSGRKLETKLGTVQGLAVEDILTLNDREVSLTR